jgi:hypothetical protein
LVYETSLLILLLYRFRIYSNGKACYIIYSMRNLNFVTIKAISLLFLILALNSSFAQTTKQSDFNCIITNNKYTPDNILEFDLYLLGNDSAVPFELASIQLGILVNPSTYNGGNVNASIVDGSSELNETQRPASIAFSQGSNILKIAARINKSITGTAQIPTRGSIISNNYPGTRVCRIRLTNTKSFNKIPDYLSYNFSKYPYPTTITRYISGINTSVKCDSYNCIVKTTK